jgi:hypothetical protein
VVCERILQELIEAEATEVIGAAPREHSETRTTWRNPHQARRPSPISRSLSRDLRHQPPWTEHLDPVRRCGPRPCGLRRRTGPGGRSSPSP